MNGAPLSRDDEPNAKRGGSAIRRYEERFLRMPAAVVLAVMWIAGAILIGLCVATLCGGVLLLARLVG